MIYVKIFEVSNRNINNQCYLAHNQYEGLLVDPAWDYDLINLYLLENGISLKGILITHGHYDHTNLANKFSLKYDIPIYLSKEDTNEFQLSYPKLKLIDHLQKFQLGTIEITPILTPGHTLGSVCYLINEHLFSGDTVFIEGVGICSKHNAELLYNSIHFLKEYLPESTRFWPGHSYGHKPGKTLSYLTIYNIYFQFDKKETFIAFRTRKNQPRFQQ